jgi:hypothetical protein
MTTQWTHILHMVVLENLNTAQNRQTFADIFADNGSGELDSNEIKMFNSVVKLSVSGSLPAQGFGLSSPVKPAMRSALEAFIETLGNGCRYFAVRQSDNMLVLTNSGVLTPPVANFTRGDVLAAINAERVNIFGLNVWRVIPNESEI